MEFVFYLLLCSGILLMFWGLVFFPSLQFNFTSGHCSQKWSSVSSFETSHLTLLAIEWIVQAVILWQWQNEWNLFLSDSLRWNFYCLSSLCVKQTWYIYALSLLAVPFHRETIVLVGHLLLLEHHSHASMIKIKLKSLFCSCQFWGSAE